MANDMMRMNDWLADPFFDDLGQRFFSNWVPARNTTALNTDIKETDQNYIAKVDVPGLAKKDIALNYQENVLSISAKQTDFNDHEDQQGNVLMSERRTGTMSRSYRLPNVDAANITATVNDGVLTITLPKLTSKASDDHHIEIN